LCSSLLSCTPVLRNPKGYFVAQTPFGEGCSVSSFSSLNSFSTKLDMLVRARAISTGRKKPLGVGESMHRPVDNASRLDNRLKTRLKHCTVWQCRRSIDWGGVTTEVLSSIVRSPAYSSTRRCCKRPYRATSAARTAQARRHRPPPQTRDRRFPRTVRNWAVSIPTALRWCWVVWTGRPRSRARRSVGSSPGGSSFRCPSVRPVHYGRNLGGS